MPIIKPADRKLFYSTYNKNNQPKGNCTTMEPFEVHILGCGSALPTTRHNASTQIVRIGNRQFMIDCGEGTQLQLRKSHVHFSFIDHIFISHLHGDHCFGLIGLISSFGLLGRKTPLHIYAPSPMEELMQPQLEFFCKELAYKVHFHTIDPSKNCVIYEDKVITVETLPQKHRIPCCGFLFKEKPKPRHLKGDVIEFYRIPHYMRKAIKEGADFTTPEGNIIPNRNLTSDADPSRSYAYCSDTLPCPQNIPLIKGCNLLYHEATFADDMKERAAYTHHSTARQAATIAKEANAKGLVIGHFSSRYTDETQLLDEARSIFPETSLADEKKCFIVT